MQASRRAQRPWGKLWIGSQTYLGLKGHGGRGCPRAPGTTTEPASPFREGTGTLSLFNTAQEKRQDWLPFLTRERGADARVGRDSWGDKLTGHTLLLPRVTHNLHPQPPAGASGRKHWGQKMGEARVSGEGG